MPTVASIKTRLRTFKPASSAYNVLNYPKLRPNGRRYRELGLRKSVVAPISHRDIARSSTDVPWLDRSDAKHTLEAHPDFRRFPVTVQAGLRSWIDDGYMVLERHFDEETVDGINADVERLLGEGELDYHFRGPRIRDAFERSDAVARVVRDPELVRLLEFLLRREVGLLQTINFLQGSQQAPHSDSFHMTTEPKGYLLGLWVALEDVSVDSGPVFYYPGSHRLPYVMTEDLAAERSGLFVDAHKEQRYAEKIAEVIADSGLEPVELLARKGDVLIWHANLLHGGRPIERWGATRRSLVAHYAAMDVLCYHEATERPAFPPRDLSAGAA